MNANKQLKIREFEYVSNERGISNLLRHEDIDLKWLPRRATGRTISPVSSERNSTSLLRAAIKGYMSLRNRVFDKSIVAYAANFVKTWVTQAHLPKYKSGLAFVKAANVHSPRLPADAGDRSDMAFRGCRGRNKRRISVYRFNISSFGPGNGLVVDPASGDTSRSSSLKKKKRAVTKFRPLELNVA